MKHMSTLKNTIRSILLAGLMCGITGVVHTQTLGGPGQVGGMGQQGAPAGEFPSQPGSTAIRQQGNSTPQQAMPGQEGSAKNSSGTQGSGSVRQGAGIGPNPSQGAPTQVQPKPAPRRD